VAGVVLLAVGIAGLRVRLHQDPGLGFVNSGLPGAGVLNEVPVLVVERALAEVPDVAVLVLRVPVERVLCERAVDEDAVVDDAAGDAEDLARRAQHGDVLA
jgi:hypothetical protein